MRLTIVARRRASIALAVLVTGCVVAACGSSSSSSSSSSASSSSGSASSTAVASAGGTSSSKRTALIACLKSHGVTLPSRPPGGFRPPSGSAGTGTPGAGGGFFGGAARNPKVQAALKACGANFGNGRFRRTLSRQNIQKYVACVRAHGYNLPNPNFSGKGSVFPANIRSNPKFQSASKACQSLLFPRRSGSTSSSTASSA